MTWYHAAWLSVALPFVHHWWRIQAEPGTFRLLVTSGAGLGLSIARSVATAHRATVIARSQPNGGLDVSVEIPRGSFRTVPSTEPYRYEPQ